jgi:hypothetical protein
VTYNSCAGSGHKLRTVPRADMNVADIASPSSLSGDITTDSTASWQNSIRRVHLDSLTGYPQKVVKERVDAVNYLFESPVEPAWDGLDAMTVR